MLYHLTKHRGDRFRRSGTSLSGALGRFVGASTNGTLPVLLPHVALRYDMPYPLAPIASGNTVVWVHVMEDRHLDQSPSTRWERDHSPNNPGCFNKGGMDQGMARVYRNWVDKAVLAV